MSLLTTLTLDGIDGAVSDLTVTALKWCTHLTALWMKGCQVTDAGIRLLASALELPGEGTWEHEGRGMWRLRAWFLKGCTGISDRSMQAFARWPALVVLGKVLLLPHDHQADKLDVRDTSCTSASMGIVNRSSQTLFGYANAKFQPCTPGLLPLFAVKSSPAVVLDNMSLTLLTSNPSTSEHFALHIVPALRPIPPEHLPESARRLRKRTNDPKTYDQNSQKISVYRAGGIGQIYGSSVYLVEDTVLAKRTEVQVALMLQAAEEEEEEDRRRASGKRKKKKEKPWNRYEKTKPGPKAKVFKEKEADERSRAFVSGVRVEDERVVEVVNGDRGLMMVRMVLDGWESLVWSFGGANAVTSSRFESTKPNSSQPLVSTKKANQGDLIGSIIAATRPTPISPSDPTPSGPFRPTIKSTTSTTTSSPAISSFPSQSFSSPFVENPFSNPFRPSETSGSFYRLFAPQVQPIRQDVSSDLSFSSGIRRKRTFEGGGTGLESTRKGLKMFSGVPRR